MNIEITPLLELVDVTLFSGISSINAKKRQWGLCVLGFHLGLCAYKSVDWPPGQTAETVWILFTFSCQITYSPLLNGLCI